MQPKYQNIEVQLSGKNGNAFMIIGHVRNALKDNNIPKEEIYNLQIFMMNKYNKKMLKSTAILKKATT